MTPDDAAWLLCGGSLDSAAAHLPPAVETVPMPWKNICVPYVLSADTLRDAAEAVKGRSFAEVMCDVYGLAP